MIQKEKIKPCPFCGKDQGFIDSDSTKRGRYYLLCCWCQTEGPLETTQRLAIRAWNRRKP